MKDMRCWRQVDLDRASFRQWLSEALESHSRICDCVPAFVRDLSGADPIRNNDTRCPVYKGLLAIDVSVDKDEGSPQFTHPEMCEICGTWHESPSEEEPQ